MQLSCRYTEGGKRGIPAAYINSLEDRLVETEAALCSALAAIDAMHPAGIAQLPVTDHLATLPQRSKVDKQHEWRRLPLRSGDQLQRWYEQKRPSTPSREHRVSPLHSPRDQAENTQALQTCPDVPQHSQHASALGSPVSSMLNHKSAFGTEARNAASLHTSAVTQWRNYF